jgi:prophage DNA circulation protein
MSWRDNLQPASFRGVSFGVDDSDLGAGRRTARHDYPQRDLPYIEDMGRKAREYRVEGHIVGKDYMTARDALLTACEQSGPGELVHPYYGRLNVICGEVSIRESSRDGGMCTVSMAFTEAGEVAYPSSTDETQQATIDAADNALAAAKTALTDTVTIPGLPAYVAEGFNGVAGDALSLANEKLASLGPLTEFQSGLSSLQSATSGSVADVSGFADGFADLVNIDVDGTTASLSELIALADFGDDIATVPTTTSSREQQSENQAAMIGYVRQVAAIVAAQVTASTTFDSYDEATEARSTIANLLDELSETAGDDLYRVLQELRAAVVQDLSDRAADLSMVLSHTPNTTLPALAIAWSLYGDIEQADDIISRNGVRHPGFVPGGEELQILSEVS